MEAQKQKRIMGSYYLLDENDKEIGHMTVWFMPEQQTKLSELAAKEPMKEEEYIQAKRINELMDKALGVKKK